MLPKILKQALNTVTSPRTKLALVVRGDLKMSKGKTAAQCAHAAVLCYQQSKQNTAKQKLLTAWCCTGQPKIVLRIDSYESMLKLLEKSKEHCVVAAMVKDAGHTQLEPGTATVLGIGPDTIESIDSLVEHLKLL